MTELLILLIVLNLVMTLLAWKVAKSKLCFTIAATSTIIALYNLAVIVSMGG